MLEGWVRVLDVPIRQGIVNGLRLRSRERTRILTGSLLHLVHDRRTVGSIGVQSDGGHVGIRLVGSEVVWGAGDEDREGRGTHAGSG